MPLVTIEEDVFHVHVLSYSPGAPPYLRGHPDNWAEGEPAEIEFEFDTGDEFTDERLTKNHYKEAETQLLESIELNHQDI